jgi:5-formyltetrahydrofolate cyclo-ligase
MTDLSAELAQQKQKLREKLRFRRKHFAANLDGMAQLAAFRALPAPLSDLLAHHAIVGAYAAWGDEPDIMPMFASLAEAGALALPHHAGRVDEMTFRRWQPGESLANGPWSTRQPADEASTLPPPA